MIHHLDKDLLHRHSLKNNQSNQKKMYKSFYGTLLAINKDTAYLLTLPLFTGVSCVRALSPAWTGSHAQETLISRTHLFLPHDIPPTKKSSTIKYLHFAINISGNSPFGTPALMKNAERYECK